MAKYEDPNQLDYRNGGDTVDDFAQKYMRTIAYVFKALNDLRTPTGNTAGVEPEPYMWRIADNKLYIRNGDNTDYVLLGEISPNFGFRQSVNDRFLTTADLEGDGAVVTRNEAGKVEGDITGSPGKIAGKTIDVTPSADNDVIAYDAAQQKWVKKTLNDYLKKQGDAGWDEMVDEVADQVINDITPIIFNFWYLDDDGYLVPLVGSTEGGLPSIHGMVGDYEQITARSVDVAGNLSATGNVTAGMVTTPQANVTTLTANAVNAGTVTADDIIAKGPVVDVRAFGAVGDGVTDDTSAFEAAISAAENNTLIIPSGNYKITSNLFADNVAYTIDYGTYVGKNPVYYNGKNKIKSWSNFQQMRTVLQTEGNDFYAQGFCYIDSLNKFVGAQINYANTQQKLIEYTLSSDGDKFIKGNVYNFTNLTHANTITYNSKTGEIYILTDNNGSSECYISVIDVSDLSTVKRTITLPYFGTGLVYNRDYDMYALLGYPTAGSNKVYFLDADFNLLKSFEYDLSIYQAGYDSNGITFKDGIISIMNTVNNIVLYKTDGTVIDTINTPLHIEFEDGDYKGDILFCYTNFGGESNNRYVSFYKVSPTIIEAPNYRSIYLDNVDLDAINVEGKYVVSKDDNLSHQFPSTWVNCFLNVTNQDGYILQECYRIAGNKDVEIATRFFSSTWRDWAFVVNNSKRNLVIQNQLAPATIASADGKTIIITIPTERLKPGKAISSITGSFVLRAEGNYVNVDFSNLTVIGGSRDTCLEIEATASSAFIAGKYNIACNVQLLNVSVTLAD